MKKFIFKTLPFVVPFMIFYFINISFAVFKEGDLVRLGYFYKDIFPKSEMDKSYIIPIKYDSISGINLNKQNSCDIFSIGDSFSQHGKPGYLNYLAHKGPSIINFDGALNGEDPIQSLVGLINSGFFERVHPKYVLLQSVERSFIKRATEISFTGEFKIDSLQTMIKNLKPLKPQKKLAFFSDGTIKMPITNLLYNFSNKPAWSKTYKAKTTTDQLFTNNPNHVLIFREDIKKMNEKNDEQKIILSNNNLNKIKSILEKKNIKLIVLIAPDKYDIYYPYIEKNIKFTQSLFFPTFNSLPKNYIYINSFPVLSAAVKREKDIYYYDDTHWSPKSSKLIANEIERVISSN